LILGKTTRQIATEAAVPLSTVQRRIRRLVGSGIIRSTFEIDYSKFGLKRGMVHVFLSGGDAYALAHKVAGMTGIISVVVYIGNSDIIADYVTASGEDLLEMLSQVKKLPDVSRVIWSEQVTSIPTGMTIASILGSKPD
jgi:DNA-binding Lrp family transcriptional regulator